MKKQKEEKDLRPFEERHPKLNLFTGFILILVILVSFLAFGMWVGKLVADVLIWLAGIASKLDAVIIVALITGMVSIIGVILSSIVSKRIEHKKSRQEYLAQKREKPYGEFIDMVYRIQQNSKNIKPYTQEEMVQDISKFSKDITLWGSPKVAEKWVKFRETNINPNGNFDNLFILEEIMNEMRKDLGLKKVKKGNLLAFFINDIKDVMKKDKK